MKVVVGGGTGLVGRALTASLAADGHETVVVSRRPVAGRSVGWEAAAAEVDGADAVVNLAGAQVGGLPWTGRRKETIRASRVETTRALAAAIESAESRPRVFVTASGTNYYGDRGDELVDESASAGDAFLSRVCVEWEAAGAAAPTRHVAVRTAFVVGRGADAIRLMALPFRLFVGGPLGGGRQFFPWIHLDDLVRIHRRALDDESLSGPVNAVAPQQRRQREAAADFGAVLHRPAILPAPGPLLRLVLGEQADLLLHSQRVVSRRLPDLEFGYQTLRGALENALA